MSSRKWASTESDSEEEVDEQHHHINNTESQEINDQPQSDHQHKSSSSGKKMGFMMNIKYGSTEADVKQFLEEQNCKIQRFEMIRDKKTNEFGRAVVYFVDETSFNNFIGLNGKKFHGMDLITKEYEDRSESFKKPYNKDRGDRENKKYSDQKYSDRGDRPDRTISKSSSRDYSRDTGKPQDFRRRDDQKFAEKDDKYHNSRREPREDRPVRPHKDHNSDHHKPAAAAEEGQEAGEEQPKERKRLVLAARTLPVEEIGKKPVTNKAADIFGGGKAHDEFAYEKVVSPVTKAEEAADELKNLAVSEPHSLPVPASSDNKKHEEGAVPPPPAISTAEEAEHHHKDQKKQRSSPKAGRGKGGYEKSPRGASGHKKPAASAEAGESAAASEADKEKAEGGPERLPERTYYNARERHRERGAGGEGRGEGRPAYNKKERGDRPPHHKEPGAHKEKEHDKEKAKESAEFDDFTKVEGKRDSNKGKGGPHRSSGPPAHQPANAGKGPHLATATTAALGGAIAAGNKAEQQPKKPAAKSASNLFSALDSDSD